MRHGDDGAQHTLRAQGYEALLAPTAGGRLMSLNWVGDGPAQPLIVPWDGQPFDPHAWPKAGAFPMLPFANRLPAQGFVYVGRRVQPQASAPGHVLHGLAHRAAWVVREAGADSLTLEWAHAPDAQWPWALRAHQTFQIGAQGLSLHLRVCNEDDVNMPLVMGWHPYHPLHDGAQLVAQARHALDEQGRAGAASPADAGLGAAPSPGDTLAFSGWDGFVRLPQGDAGAIITRSRGAYCLVLHTAHNGRYLCVEPVTQLPGHLVDAPAPDILAPGETAHLKWSCAWQAS